MSTPALPRTVDADSGSPERRSLVEMNAKAAYELPLYFGLGQLLKLATAKRDEAQDSIWALREDPSYFREVLEEESIFFREVAHKALKATGMKIPSDSRHSLFDSSCLTLIEQFYTRLMLRDLLLSNLGKLRSLRFTLNSEQLRGNSWRADYKEALERFTVGIWTICDTAIVQLRQAASMSKPL